MFHELCGSNSLNNVLFVTTEWDPMTPANEEREKDLMSDSLQPMLGLGARTTRHENSSESTNAIIRQLLRKSPTELGIQNQLVDEKEAVRYTDAGVVLKAKVRRHHNEWEAQQEGLVGMITKKHDRNIKVILERSKTD